GVGPVLPLAKAGLGLVGDALHEASGADEDEGAAVLLRHRRHAVVDLVPHLVAGDRAQRLSGNVDGEVPVAAMADVDDGAVGPATGIDPGGPDKQAGDVLDGPLGRRQADALAAMG